MQELHSEWNLPWMYTQNINQSNTVESGNFLNSPTTVFIISPAYFQDDAQIFSELLKKCNNYAGQLLL